MNLELMYRVLTARTVTMEDLGTVLQGIYADGFMEKDEESDLTLLTRQSAFVKVAPEVHKSIQKVLEHRAYLASQYRRFESELPPSLQSANFKPPASDAVTVELAKIEPLPKEGYRLEVLLRRGGELPLSVPVELPNTEGRYADGKIAGREDLILREIHLSLAWQALEKYSLPEEARRSAMEAVGRIGELPLTEIKRSNSYGPMFMPDFFPFDEIARMAREICQKDGTQVAIRGLTLLIPYKDAKKVEEVRKIYEEQLKPLPDYLLRAIAQKIGPIVIYDPAQIIPKCYEDPSLRMMIRNALPAYVNWTRYPHETNSHEKATLFISLGSAPNALVHEFGHVLGEFIPKRNTPKYYEEEVVPTNYIVSRKEPFPEALMLFHQGASFRPNRVGTRDELKREDPILFLTLVQLDALLEDQYSESGEQKGPGYKAAFTRFVRARAQAYLDEKRSQWSDPANLAAFREGTLLLKANGK